MRFSGRLFWAKAGRRIQVSAFLLFRMKSLVQVDLSPMDVCESLGGAVAEDYLPKGGMNGNLRHFQIKTHGPARRSQST
jgi:hypothetical protein